MEMQQITELLLAKMKDEIKEVMNTNQEMLARMEAKVEVNQEEMRINQAKVDAHMEAN
jgi:hypothetical protein